MSQKKECLVDKQRSQRNPPTVKIEQRLSKEMSVALAIDPTRRMFMLWFKDGDKELQVFFPENQLWKFNAMLQNASETMKDARKAARKKKLPRRTSAARSSSGRKKLSEKH